MTTKGKYADGKKQIEKDKKSLQAFAVENLKGRMKKDVDHELYSYPGFVVMPNCPRPNSAVKPSNGVFKEDCENLEAFSKWWDKNVKRKAVVDQELFNYLVMRWVT